MNEAHILAFSLYSIFLIFITRESLLAARKNKWYSDGISYIVILMLLVFTIASIISFTHIFATALTNK